MSWRALARPGMVLGEFRYPARCPLPRRPRRQERVVHTRGTEIIWRLAENSP
jgi:hypothetical protein